MSPTNGVRATDAASYGASPIKRFRRTKAAVEDIKSAIYEVVAADPPMTVRQVFYQLVVKGAIEKTEKEYQRTVIRLLTDMRVNDEIDFDWIIDESRRRRETETFDNVTDALESTAKFYRRSALRESSDYVEIWSEKEALSGLIWDVASEYDAPVVVSKGMPSLSQIYISAKEIERADLHEKQTFIYQFGDHDPSGVLIPEAIEGPLRELCEKFDCRYPEVERVALTEKQIAEYSLPTRPTKRDGNTHAKNFDGESVELDALPPNVLRGMVRKVIERHIAPLALEVLRASEESEREIIRKLARTSE